MKFLNDIKRNKGIYLLMIPVMAFFIIFAYVPMGGLVMAFQNYTPKVVIVCGIIADFTASDGVITDLIVRLGGERINYLGQPEYFRTIYVLSDMWQGIGFNSIIYLAALSGIDQGLYEAAALDGANRWKQTLHVTLPGIASTIIILLILRMGSMFAVGYEKIILLYSTNTFETADVISSYVYRKGLQEFNYSYSTAVGLFNSLINTTLLVLSNKLSRKFSDTSLF